MPLPVMAPCLLPAALDDALFHEGMERGPAEPRAADATIKAVQDVVPVTIGHELGHRARSHTAPVGVPALVVAADGNFALARRQVF